MGQLLGHIYDLAQETTTSSREDGMFTYFLACVLSFFSSTISFLLSFFLSLSSLRQKKNEAYRNVLMAECLILVSHYRPDWTSLTHTHTHARARTHTHRCWYLSLCLYFDALGIYGNCSECKQQAGKSGKLSCKHISGFIYYDSLVPVQHILPHGACLDSVR